MKSPLRMQKRWIVPVLGTVLIAAAGGVAVGGNMAFRLIKPIVFKGPAGSQIGSNWTSIPYLNPYPNVAAFCSMTGLTMKPLPATVTNLNATTGLFSSPLCGSSAARTTMLIPGMGIQIQQPNTPGARSSIVILGSHDPSLAITIPKAGSSGSQVGNYWFSVPYHTTAVTVRDLCIQAGLTSVGTPATITRLNATTGLFSTPLCGSPAAATTNLVLGEFVQIRDPGGPKTFIPDHF